ncbi:MAG: hypothetical protein ACRDJW_03540 [Thermomicrobiales bacterium]
MVLGSGSLEEGALERLWYRQDRVAVQTALAAGERPDLATTMARGPLDELVALHDELGILDSLDEAEVARERAGLPDGLLLRTLATLPFVADASLSGAAGALFREPAILLRLGWTPVALRAATNGRHRHPAGRRPESLPCHPDALRDAPRRVGAAAWDRVQRAGVAALYARRLVRGAVYAIDGSGLGADLRVVALVCVSATRPVIVAWRLLEGTASEKGKEACVTRALVEQVLAVGGPGTIRLLLADALYADGPLLAWLQGVHDIDALVRLPADRCLDQELAALAAGDGLAWRTHHEVRTVRGHKARRRVEVAGLDGLTSWDSVVAAAVDHGQPEATLWGPDPGGAPRAVGQGRDLGAGQHPSLAQRLRRPAGVPGALARRGRRLPGVEGGLGAGGATVGARRGGGTGAADADVPGLQHRPGLPQPSGRARGAVGDPAAAPPAPAGHRGSAGRPLRRRLLRCLRAGRPARSARRPRPREPATGARLSGPMIPYLQMSATTRTSLRSGKTCSTSPPSRQRTASRFASTRCV